MINFVSHGVSKIGADDDRQVRGASEAESEDEHEEGEGDDEEGDAKTFAGAGAQDAMR